MTNNYNTNLELMNIKCWKNKKQEKNFIKRFETLNRNKYLVIFNADLIKSNEVK